MGERCVLGALSLAASYGHVTRYGYRQARGPFFATSVAAFAQYRLGTGPRTIDTAVSR
jgi:hypothetical protein